MGNSASSDLCDAELCNPRKNVVTVMVSKDKDSAKVKPSTGSSQISDMCMENCNPCPDGRSKSSFVTVMARTDDMTDAKGEPHPLTPRGGRADSEAAIIAQGEHLSHLFKKPLRVPHRARQRKVGCLFWRSVVK